MQAALSSSKRVGPWIQPMVLRIPLQAMTSAMRACATAFISDSAVDVDTLPWPVFCGTHSKYIFGIYIWR